MYLLHGLHTQTLGSGSGWAQAALRPQENRTASPHVDAESKLLLEKTKGFPWTGHEGLVSSLWPRTHRCHHLLSRLEGITSVTGEACHTDRGPAYLVQGVSQSLPAERLGYPVSRAEERREYTTCRKACEAPSSVPGPRQPFHPTKGSNWTLVPQPPDSGKPAAQGEATGLQMGLGHPGSSTTGFSKDQDDSSH